MSGRFEPLPGGGAAIALDEVEISILRSLAMQLAELIGPGDQPAGDDDDPLAALFAEGPSKPPEDPALARLFPDAYSPPDRELGAREEKEAREASAEFRRFTENDLRARKRDDALTVVRDLDALGSGSSGGAPGVLELAPEKSGRWLGALNDLRLAIGTRLEVTDEDDGGELLRLPDSDPRKPMVMAYFWLGGLQETLIETLMPE
ncbi:MULTISPECIES: DUF2017 domain-containing protein [Streptomyces violaceusniger group]|uniref:DUF2017 domain-containing protein n=2 Tax=Streptomyces javensis TaxID=114698 RepID=A0ABS0REU9_9ACTN|nr:DUF2017 domain-containing protein [Streptomyces javensis]MBI0315853.1 DUF2017 domain-containing protein [Streptomyces javensis]